MNLLNCTTESEVNQKFCERIEKNHEHKFELKLIRFDLFNIHSAPECIYDKRRSNEDVVDSKILVAE